MVPGRCHMVPGKCRMVPGRYHIVPGRCHMVPQGDILVGMVIGVIPGHLKFIIAICIILRTLKKNIVTKCYDFGMKQCSSLNLQKIRFESSL